MEIVSKYGNKEMYNKYRVLIIGNNNFVKD